MDEGMGSSNLVHTSKRVGWWNEITQNLQPFKKLGWVFGGGAGDRRQSHNAQETDECRGTGANAKRVQQFFVCTSTPTSECVFRVGAASGQSRKPRIATRKSLKSLLLGLRGPELSRRDSLCPIPQVSAARRHKASCSGVMLRYFVYPNHRLGLCGMHLVGCSIERVRRNVSPTVHLHANHDIWLFDPARFPKMVDGSGCSERMFCSFMKSLLYGSTKSCDHVF
jgi:hypothetical protein